MKKKFKIVVGIIRSYEGKVFITQRPENSHLAGFWEFPGGKVKKNESLNQALFRELYEEIDIRIIKSSFFTSITHEYNDRFIELFFYFIDEWDGQPFAKEGQASKWVLINELNIDDFPDANRTIIEQLKN